MDVPIFRVLIFVVLLILTIGCVKDEDRRDEVRKKVIAGEYEEASRLAKEYFADDKRILLVTQEYIAFEKKKALTEAYKNRLIIENLNWSTDRSGVTGVAGKLLNRGNKTITGFGIKIACRRAGKVVHETRAQWIAEIGPGMYEDFEATIEGLGECEDLVAIVVDLGLKD